MAARDIIHFLSSPTTNESYCDRMQKYLQPDYVRGNFSADTAADFKRITQVAGTNWEILVIDAARLQSDLAAVRAFADANPSSAIAVLGPGNLAGGELPKISQY